MRLCPLIRSADWSRLIFLTCKQSEALCPSSAMCSHRLPQRANIFRHHAASCSLSTMLELVVCQQRARVLAQFIIISLIFFCRLLLCIYYRPFCQYSSLSQGLFLLLSHNLY